MKHRLARDKLSREVPVMKKEHDAKKRGLSDQEMRKRLYQEVTAGPEGTETSLSRMGTPLGPTGEHLTEPERRSDK